MKKFEQFLLSISGFIILSGVTGCGYPKENIFIYEPTSIARSIPEERPFDFGIRLKYGPGNVLDMFEGTYKKVIGSSTYATIGFQVSEAQLDSIWLSGATLFPTSWVNTIPHLMLVNYSSM